MPSEHIKSKSFNIRTSLGFKPKPEPTTAPKPIKAPEPIKVTLLENIKGKIVKPLDPQEALEKHLYNLNHEDPALRSKAARALGQLKNPEAFPHLINALKDEEVRVRWAAVHGLGDLKGSLGNFEHPEALKSLINALKDEDKEVRSSAAVQLRNYNHPDALSALLETSKTDADGFTRASAKWSIMEFTHPKYVPLLMEALKDRGTAEIAHMTLDKVTGREAAPHLINALKDESPSVRYKAAEMLGTIRSAESVYGLTEALKDKNRDVRSAALESLSTFGFPMKKRLLEARAQTNDPEFREEIDKVLRKMEPNNG